MLEKLNCQNNMNELKYELFKLVLSKSSEEINEALVVTQKLLNFLEVEKPIELKNQRPIIDIINEKIESDKTLRDPLQKEYTRHRLVSDFVSNELEVGIQKLCLDIDKRLGVPPLKDYISDKLAETVMNSLEVDGNKCCVSSKGYESPFTEEDTKEKTYSNPKTILTGNEEKDKQILTELIEKYDEDVESSNNNNKSNKSFFHRSYPLVPTVVNKPAIFNINETDKKVFDEIRDIVKDI